ncbi:MAG: peptidoglycan-binding protein [Actinomycetota bacterium]|nr:peptidoglycan-binding protein [Actinomycetota bacterium]
MTPSATITLLALPEGADPDRGILRVSVVVLPRLQGAQRLADFLDWQDWTAWIAAGASVSLTLGTAAPEVLTLPTGALRLDLWKGIFSGGARVEPYTLPDYDQRLIVSYPADVAVASLADTYGKAGGQATFGGATWERQWQTLTEPYARAPAHEPYGPAVRQRLREQAWQAQREDDAPGRARAASTDPPSPSDRLAMVEQFHLFHSQPTAFGRPPLPSSPAELSALLDFHGALGALRSYPQLERALGLVFDLELPLDAVGGQAAVGSAAELPLTAGELVPDSGWSTPTSLFSVPVACHLSLDGSSRPTTFLAASTPHLAGDVDSGLLRLPAAFTLAEVDPDSALHALAVAAEVPADGDGLPALRSGGLQLLANDRASALKRALERGRAIEDALVQGDGAGVQPLRAVDLVLGYRIDIWSAVSDSWHSLHRRSATYTVGEGDSAAVLAVGDEEGYVHLAVTAPAQDPTRPPDPPSVDPTLPPSDGDIYAHERVARWNGWSLSVPRPGQPLNRDADPGKAVDPEPADQPVTPFKLTSDYAVVPRTLPRLRFGDRYRVRARAVDLAGRSVNPDAAPPGDQALPVTGDGLVYHRYEPIAAPILVPRTDLSGDLGASLERMVIRSRNATDADDGLITAERSDRHVLPPRASVDLVERHGMLDGPAGVRSDPATYTMLSERDAAELPGTPHPVVPAASCPVPYLADPLAERVVVSGAPGLPPDAVTVAGPAGLQPIVDPDAYPRSPGLLSVPSTGTWPDVRSLRIELQEGEGAEWDPEARLLTVRLPKAGRCTLQLSSGFPAGQLGTLGVWDWIGQSLIELEQQALADVADPDQGILLSDVVAWRGALTQLALDGRHRMLTPPRTLELVHAVQRPLAAPQILPDDAGADRYLTTLETEAPGGYSPMRAWRDPGAVDAYLLGVLRLHGASTARVDIAAVWSDPVDVPGSGPPGTQVRHATIDELRLDTLDDHLVRGPKPELPAGRYLPDQDLIWLAEVGQPLGRLIAEERHAVRHHFADTRHRRVTYSPTATSRFRECFPAGTDVERAGPPTVVDVPSSTRPAAPRIRYVVPALRWARTRGAGSTTSVREGGLLRILLERPWWSSGEGELLGVATWASPTEATDAERKGTYFSQWGLDPIWSTRPDPSQRLSVDHFPDRVSEARGLSLPDGNVVDVAAFAVHYDPDRDLWFADVRIDLPRTYGPFVRLALCRYQPCSLPDCELSAPAVADVAQLLPERSVTILSDPADGRRHPLVVAGIGPAGPERNEITVKVQQRDPVLTGDLGWNDAPSSSDVLPDPIGSDPDTLLWAGTVVCHAPGDQLRIVVREDELLPADPIWQLEPIGGSRDLSALVDAGRFALEQATIGAIGDGVVVSADTGMRDGPVGGDRALQRVSVPESLLDTDRVIDRSRLELRPVLVPQSTRRPVFLEIIELWPGAGGVDGALGGGGPGGGGPAGGVVGPNGGAVGSGAPGTPAVPQNPSYPPVLDPDGGAGLAGLPASLSEAVAGPLVLAQALLNAAVPGGGLALDGVVGPLTAAALASFRGAQGLPADATLDSETWARLLAFTSFATLEPGRGSAPMTGPPVRTVQDLLGFSGVVAPPPITSAFDPATTTAVGDFQDAVGVPRTEIVDQPTWRALEALTTELAPAGVIETGWSFDSAAAPVVNFLFGLPSGGPALPTDTRDDVPGASGWWVEWRDLGDRPLWRQFLHDPFGLEREAPSDPGFAGDFASGASAATGMASIPVPDLPNGAVLVIVGAPGDGAAAELGRATRAQVIGP